MKVRNFYNKITIIISTSPRVSVCYCVSVCVCSAVYCVACTCIYYTVYIIYFYASDVIKNAGNTMTQLSGQ